MCKQWYGGPSRLGSGFRLMGKGGQRDGNCSRNGWKQNKQSTKSCRTFEREKMEILRFAENVRLNHNHCPFCFGVRIAGQFGFTEWCNH